MSESFGSNRSSIGVFYEPPEKEVSVRAPLKKPEVAMDGDKVVEKQEIIEDEKWKAFIAKLFYAGNDGEDAQEILDKNTWIKEDTKVTIQILIDTGEFDWGNKASAIASTAAAGIKSIFTDNKFELDKGRRLEEMGLAIQKAEEGLGVHIMLSSGGSFTSDNLKNYEKKMNVNVGEILNGSIIKGLLGLYKKSGENPKNTFQKDSWANIGLYIESRSGNTKITNGLSEEDKKILKDLAIDKRKSEEAKIQKILTPVIDKLGIENKKLKDLLQKENILVSNGDISIMGRIDSAKGLENMTMLKETVFRNSENLKNEADILFNESDAETKKHGYKGKSVKEIFSNLKKKLKNKIHPEKQKKIEEILNSKNLKESTPVINQLNPQQAQLAIQTLNEVLGEVGDTKNINEEKNEINALLEIAGLQDTGHKKIAESAHLNNQAKAIGKSKDPEEAKKNLQATEDRKNEVGQVAQNQNILSRQEKELQELGIRNIKDANEEIKKLSEIEKRRTLTDDESARKNTCLSYLETQKALSQNYIDIKAKFGEKAAQDIITDTGRFISNDPKKTYNFASREAIGIINNPESTPQERAFSKIGIGQSLPLSEFMSGNTAQSDIPELQSIKISKNKNGNFDIPGLKIDNINQAQVIECIDTMELYGDIGLSQLIPHIPMITGELRKKGINTSIDGSSNTVEQQEILKEIYLLLFGRKIETSNIHEVIRGFKSNLGNPTNMKNAMQHVLKIHHLIGESGQSIAPDTLQKWIRGNQKTLENDMNPLAYI